MSTLPIFMTCAAGVESLLDEEIKRILPGAKIYPQRGGVRLDGGPSEVMALNLHSRLAQRVLIQVGEIQYANATASDEPPFRRDAADRTQAVDENALYEMALGIDWTQWITPQQTMRVDSKATNSPIHSLNFANLRIKDGVCDSLRNATGERPSVDTRAPDLPLVLHLGPQWASLYVDSSGEPLFKRGWREDKGDAPLKETLAAAMLAAAGWRGTPDAGGALMDPCCGSGTIAIEAAQIARNMAPGMQRRFAFERLAPFCSTEMRAQWQRLKSQAKSAERPCAVPIHCSDVAFRMVDFARRNAERAGVLDCIEFHGGDALERPAPVLPDGMSGTLMMNPPYGERIEVRGKAGVHSLTSRDVAGNEERQATDSDFFSRLASHWKRAYTLQTPGWTAWLLCPDMKLPNLMRLKAARRVPMWNGPIECRLFRFDLVAGSARDKPASLIH